MEKRKEDLMVYLTGAGGYGLLELCTRGYTHWSMLLTGGTCLLLFYRFHKKYRTAPIVVKCLAATGIITALEFLVGCIVNVGFQWQVWDYSNRPFNVLGQICLLFSVLWFLLGVPMSFLCAFLERRFRRFQKA